MLLLALISAVLLVSCDETVFDLNNSLLHTVNHCTVVCADDYRCMAVPVDLKEHCHDSFGSLRV